jgi:hypothetical protein
MADVSLVEQVYNDRDHRRVGTNSDTGFEIDPPPIKGVWRQENNDDVATFQAINNGREPNVPSGDTVIIGRYENRQFIRIRAP